jgi:hypothetical protein
MLVSLSSFPWRFFFCLSNVCPMQGHDDIHFQHFVTICLVGHCFHVLGTKTTKRDNERISLYLNHGVKEPRQEQKC